MPLECSILSWVEWARLSAMMLLEKVMRRLVPARHSSGVFPVKRGPETERFSSLAQVRVQWSTMMFQAAPAVEMASSFQPLFLT